MKKIEYRKLKDMLKEGKIKKDSKIECFVPDSFNDITYIDVTVKEILDWLDETDLEFALFTIFDEG